jgi:hypothetical protein
MFNGECLSDLGFYHQNDPLFKDGLMSSEIDKNRFERAKLNLGNPRFMSIEMASFLKKIHSLFVRVEHHFPVNNPLLCWS